MTLPSRARVDRYPARMVGRLAHALVEKYTRAGDAILDPFCGSGAVLTAALVQHRNAMGFDINPYAVLLSEIRTNGFPVTHAWRLWTLIENSMSTSTTSLPLSSINSHYWFTDAVIRKYELIRGVAQASSLYSSLAGRAVLLAVALSVRACSRADQRSPKPFISRAARATRRGKRYDPIVATRSYLRALERYYGTSRSSRASAHVEHRDFVRQGIDLPAARFDAVITSPPYINAQDYYRNFKLEAAVLEEVMPFGLQQIKTHFVGTERGDLLGDVQASRLSKYLDLDRRLSTIGRRSQRRHDVVIRYLNDMERCLLHIAACLKRQGKFILVCGDNLVAGVHLRTWRLLDLLAVRCGFRCTGSFVDRIVQRSVPPKRMGHSGLIKQERVLVYELS